MKKSLHITIIDKTLITKISKLVKQLNPEKSKTMIEKRLNEMFDLDHYKCFGLFENNKLIGVSSVWSSIRLHCGRRLELDNVIIDNTLQSKGYGKYFIDYIEDWAKENGYESLELNTYVQNSRSHKFYFNQGFNILGFNFQKLINKS